MEWSERMNAAISYIENNLAGEIDFAEAAKKAYFFLFHFHRMEEGTGGKERGQIFNLDI